MKIDEKIDKFICEATHKENTTVQKIINDLSRLYIKTQKEKSVYAHNERSLSKNRYSEYVFLDSKGMISKVDDIKKVFIRHGFKDELANKQRVDRWIFRKSADEYIELHLNKMNKMEDEPALIIFNYLRDSIYAWEK